MFLSSFPNDENPLPAADYVFGCTVNSHYYNEMVGTLKVS